MKKPRRIPKRGIVGETALREAFDGSFQEIMRLLEAAIKTLFEAGGDTDVWPWIKALFPDRFVVERDGKLLQYGYTITDAGDVSLGEPVQVTESFEPMTEAQGPFLEALAGGGARWRIRVIRAGLSGNRVFYPDAVLREATALFDGARVFVKGDEEHGRGEGKDVRNLIGALSDPKFIKGAAPDTGEIQATLELLGASGDIPAKMAEAWERGLTGLFGFSIAAEGRVKHGRVDGKAARIAESIGVVHSVDLIVEPGAGGEIIELIEGLKAQTEEDDEIMTRDQLIKLIEATRPDLAARITDETDEAALTALLTEAMASSSAAAQAAAAGGGAPSTSSGQAVVTMDEVNARIALVEAKAHARAAIAASNLPEIAKARLRKDFGARERFTEAEIDKAIEGETEYLARFTESGHVAGLGDASRIGGGEQQFEKVEKMLDAFFDPEDGSVTSFKECYVHITGDTRVTGQLERCDAARMREAAGPSPFREALTSSSFSSVLGDSITRRMIKDYRTPSRYDVWREAADVVPISDFRTNERTRYGGYGDLPVVNQGDPYTALTSPTDEKATYAVAKRGGTETMTIEMIKNDDVGVIRRIPMNLSRAAKRTLSKFVLDLFVDNPAIYDGVAFFHASHNNLGSAALDATSYAAARLAMLQQTEKDSGDRLGIGPAKLWVPSDLEENSVDLFRRNTNLDATFLQSLSPDIIPVWYWIDANDWVATADVMDIPVIEVGFLDGNEEPELFVQDLPTVGSLFSNDQVTHKVRHVYGAAVVDFRGAYKGVVA